MNPYIASIILVVLLGAVLFYTLRMKSMIPQFSTEELITVALFCSLLYIAILPFKFGLSRIPVIQAFFFSVSYTAILAIGIRLVPKAGTVTMLICGHSLLSQILSSGVNPLWWPYALLAGFVLEIYFLTTGNYLGTMRNALGAGAVRGFTVYVYFYYFSAPYIWHQHFAPWYIWLQAGQGMAGSALGAAIGFYLSRTIIQAFRYGGI
ncbi:MAG: hypothetical protein JW950_09690 [Deltaproteobacteria bacterium]|nr:hypothetical protein [Deltaproteobacteria bacterium]